MCIFNLYEKGSDKRILLSMNVLSIIVHDFSKYHTTMKSLTLIFIILPLEERLSLLLNVLQIH